MRQRTAVLFGLLLVASGAGASVTFEHPYNDGAVVMLWQANYTAAQIDAILARAVQAGVRAVEVPVFGCQSTITSADVGSCTLGSYAQELLIIQRAVAAGLPVSVLPIVGTPQWDWRGTFDPTDSAGWFKTYETWLTQVAKDVLAAGASELIAGSEFKILYEKYPSQWSALLHDLRPVFPGPLVVTGNWDELNYPFWGDSDAIGISVYFPLTTSSGTPAQSDLNNAWAKERTQLLALATKYSKPLYFTEVGYNNTTAAALTPWGPPTGGAPQDLALQAQCFTALQSAWAGDKTLVRANVWAVGDPSTPSAFDFLNTPSEAILTAFFAARAAL